MKLLIRACRCLGMCLLRKYAIPRMAKCRPPHLVQILLILHRFRAGKVVVVTTSCKDNHTTSLTCCGCWKGCYWWSGGWGSTCNRALCCGKIQQIQTNTANTNKYSKKIEEKEHFQKSLLLLETSNYWGFSFWGISNKHWSNHKHLGCFLTSITSRLCRMPFNIDYIEIIKDVILLLGFTSRIVYIWCVGKDKNSNTNLTQEIVHLQSHLNPTPVLYS